MREKLHWWDRFLLFPRECVVFPEGPEAFVVIFKDGEKYEAYGDRKEGGGFEYRVDGIKRVVGAKDSEPRRTNREIADILKRELKGVVEVEKMPEIPFFAPER